MERETTIGSGRRARTAALGMGLFLLLGGPADAAAPLVIGYQGSLGDAEGTPLDDRVTFDIGIWNAAAGGDLLYRELHLNVDVVGGLFQLGIGSGVTTTDGLFTQLGPAVFGLGPAFLQVRIDGETLSPRQPLASVPYALHAESLQGASAAQLDQSAHVADTGNPHGVTAAQVGASTPGSVQADIAAHATQAGAHHAPYTSSQAVGAVLAADGPGSGLDADRLDGLDSAAFVRNTSGSVTGALIADGSITAADLGSDSVGTSEIANDSIRSFDIAADAIAAHHIRARAVADPEQIAGSTLRLSHFDSHVIVPAPRIDVPTVPAQTCRGFQHDTGPSADPEVHSLAWLNLDPDTFPKGVFAVPVVQNEPGVLKFVVCNATNASINPPQVEYDRIIARP